MKVNQEMPNCAEKNAIKIFEMAENNFRRTRESIGPLFVLEDFKREYCLLLENLKEEEIASRELKSIVDELESSIARLSLEDIIKHSTSLLKNCLRPFDIDDFTDLVEKSKQATESMDRKDIILLLGRTGTGKSTTIHWLAGSTMAEVSEVINIDGVDNIYTSIKPTEIKNPQLNSVITKHSSHSVTRYVNAVTVNAKDFGAIQDKPVILCDSPGFFDTDGAEVDLSNGVSLINAIQRCNSVRVLVLFSYKSSGDRGELIKEVAHLLARMVPKIGDYLSSFAYAFTKVPENKEENVKTELEMLVNELSTEDKKDEAFISFLEDLRRKNRKKLTAVINPLDRDQAGDFLLDLTDLPGISEPENVFRYSPTTNSLAKLNAQLEKNRRHIEKAIKERNYLMIDYRLGQIKALLSSYDDSMTRTCYTDCVQLVKNHVSEVRDLAICNLNRSIEDERGLDIRDVQEYKVAIMALGNTAAIRKKYLDEDSAYSEELIQNLQIALNKLAEKIISMPFTDILLEQRTKKFCLLSEEFSEIQAINTQYLSMKERFREKFIGILESAVASLHRNDFNLLLQFLEALNSAQPSSSNLIDEAFSIENITKLNDIIINYFSSLLEPLFTNKNTTFNDYTRSELNKALSVFHEIEELYTIHNYVPIAIIKGMRHSFLTKLVNYHLSLVNMLQDLYKNKKHDSFLEMKDFVIELKALNEVVGFRNFLSESAIKNKDYKTYDTIEFEIATYLKTMAMNIKNFLSLILGAESNVTDEDMQELANSVTGLRNAAWFKELRPEVYEDTTLDVEDKLVQFATYLKDKLNSLNLIDISGHADVVKASKFLDKITKVSELIKNELVEKIKKEAADIFWTAVESAIKHVDNNFDLERIKISNFTSRLEDLKRFRSMCLKEITPQKLFFMALQSEINDIGFLDIFDETSLINRIQSLSSNRDEISQIIGFKEADKKEKAAKIKERISNISELLKNYLDNEDVSVLSEAGIADFEQGQKQNREAKSALYQLEKDNDAEIKVLESKRSEIVSKLKALQSIHSNFRSTDFGKAVELKDRNYAYVDELDEEIVFYEERIKAYESTKYTYAFENEIDVNKYTNIFEYLLNCKMASIPSLRTLAQDKIAKVEKYLSNFGEFILDRLEHNYSFILNYIEKDNEEDSDRQNLRENTQEIVRWLKSISMLKSNSELVYEKFGFAKSFDTKTEWLDKIKSLADSLEDKIHESSSSNNIIFIVPRLTVARLLSELDQLIGNNLYGKLYQDARKQYVSGKLDLQSQLQIYIQDKQFDLIPGLLKQSGDDALTPNLKHILSRSINSLVMNARQKVIKLGNILKLEDISSIADDLKKINEATEYLSKYIDEGKLEAIISGKIDVCKSLSESIVRYLKRVEANITAHNFFDAEEKISEIRAITGLLSEFNFDNISGTITEVVNKINQTLEDILNKYEASVIEDYPSNSPKEIHQRILMALQCGDDRYKLKSDKLEEIIQRKYDQRILAIEEEMKKSLNTPKRAIQVLERSIKYVPVNLTARLEERLVDLKDSAIAAEANYDTRIKNAVSSNDVHVIAELVNEFKASNDGALLAQLGEKFILRFREQSSEFKSNWYSKRYDQAVVGLFPLVNLHDSLRTKFSEVSLVFKEIQSIIIGFVEDVSKRTKMNLITDINSASSSEAKQTDLNQDFEGIIVLFENIDELKTLSEGFDAKVLGIISHMVSFFTKNADIFSKADSSALDSIRRVLVNTKTWKPLYIRLARSTKVQEFFPDIKICPQYEDMLVSITNNITKVQDDIEKILKEGLITPDNRSFNEKERAKYYTSLNAKLLMVKNFPTISKHIDNCSIQSEEILRSFASKIKNIIIDLSQAINQKNIEKDDYENISISYNHIKSIYDHITAIRLDATDHEDLITKIFAMIEKARNLATLGIKERSQWELSICSIKPTQYLPKTFYLLLNNSDEVGVAYLPDNSSNTRKFLTLNESGIEKNLLSLQPKTMKPIVLLPNLPGVKDITCHRYEWRVFEPYYYCRWPDIRGSMKVKCTGSDSLPIFDEASFSANQANGNLTLEIYIEHPKEAVYLSKKDSKIIAHYYDSSTRSMIAKEVTAIEKHLPAFPKDAPHTLRQYDEHINHKINSMYRNPFEEIAYSINSRPDVKSNILKILFDNFINPLDLIVKNLQELKLIATYLLPFTNEANKAIDKLLKLHRDENREEGMLRLRDELSKSELGRQIQEEHQIFKGGLIQDRNLRTSVHDINYVLQNLEVQTGVASPSKADFNSQKELKKNYDRFLTLYQSTVDKYLPSHNKLDDLIVALKHKAGKYDVVDSAKIKWDKSVREAVVEVMAYVFALWTLKNAKYYFESTEQDSTARSNYLLKPHAAQIITIFKLLGVEEGISSNLVQVGTGEGKSVVLAVSASVLALFGIEVSCACYSEYLSRRDYEDFQSIFQDLGIEELIHYGTFNQLCEQVVNGKGNIRELTKALLLEPKKSDINKKVISKVRPKILLIDEVDVFFNKDFYGNVYSPVLQIRDKKISDLVNYIWLNRNSLRLDVLKKATVYIECANLFNGSEFLLEESVKDMLRDVKIFSSQDYIVKNGKIGYKDQDTIVFNIVYDYKTMFAYFNEADKGTISPEKVQEFISLQIKCGNFSFAEIPKNFNHIMGVSGTLRDLNQLEKQVIARQFGISRFSYAPSVFGKNNLIFEYDNQRSLAIEESSEYFSSIARMIEANLRGPQGRRAVIVFFESTKRLMDFYNSQEFSIMKERALLFTEDLSATEKESYVKRATAAGQITLSNPVFGRGTDFICHNPEVIRNGGVHVIQAFLSEQQTEETQIKGRTARQGQQGSFSMVLSIADLEKFSIKKEEIEIERAKGKIYELLIKKRQKYFESEYKDNDAFITSIRGEHEKSMAFVANLQPGGKPDEAKKFLQERNVGAPIIQSTSRTICLMDATGSMSHLLNKAKNTVGIMFERASEILSSGGLPSDCFEMQFAVYRNYNCNESELLGFSPWESKPANLHTFMKGISSAGGWGNEAIEIGLWHVNNEDSVKDVTQVILIGDAPSNSELDVTLKRAQSFGEAYWKGTKFSQPTFYRKEADKLSKRGIPVHTFFVHENARSNFLEISNLTGGRSEFLDINSDAGANQLTDLVTKEVLRNIGTRSGDTKKAEELVKSYESRFGRGYV